MKKTKIFTLILLSLIGLFSIINHVVVKATIVETDERIKVIGAQIRTTDPVAIRFVGMNDNYSPPSHNNVSSYGIIICYGIPEDNKTFIKGGVVNGYNVLCGEFSENPYNKMFYVNLINIPEIKYPQAFSARGYIKLDNGKIIYSKDIITRSLLSVATNAKYDHINSPKIDEILEYVSLHYKKIYFNSRLSYCIDNPIYEYDYLKLKEMFVDDYNRVMNTNIKTIYEFYNDSTGEYKENQTKEEVFNTRLYTFFNVNNKEMYMRWKFLLDFMSIEENIMNTYLNASIDIVKGEGIQYNVWLGGSYLAGYLVGFFTKSTYTFEGIDTIDFSTIENEKFYNLLVNEKFITNRDLSKERIERKDYTINLPEPIKVPGMKFNTYKLGSTNYKIGDPYVINIRNAEFKAVYENILR